MSRMSSWNRPSKHSAIPPPYYITVGEDTPYCQTCGRIMNARKPAKNAKTNTESKTPVKYCSDRCRRRKPGVLDRDIEQAFVSLLEDFGDVDDEISKTAKSRSKKGDSRILVKMDDVERLVFGDHPRIQKARRGKRNVLDPDQWRSVDMESSESERDSDGDAEDQGGVGVGVGVEAEQDADMISFKPKFRTSKHISDADTDANKNDEAEADKAHLTPEDIERRDEGQKRAEHKEMVRRAARRGVVFGFIVAEDPASDTRRMCEAVVNGSVVEPSFAKGNWGIRWRE